MKKLHQTKSFSYKDKETKTLHRAINDHIMHGVNSGIRHEVPKEMMTSLKNDVFIFSGMKTYAELKEASQLLTTPDGQVKSFNQFAQDVQKINDTYNQSYLEAEYNFATSSAQMAANWANIDTSSDLQYRTAGDDRVRPEHQVLDKITLPATDKFWGKYYPPNGWNCRCLAVEVNPGKYDRSDSSNAEELGERATTQYGKDGSNTAAIFRFNPGQQKIIFPPTHPYYAQHCNGAKLNVSKLIGKARIVLANEEEKCQWQNELKNQLPVQPSSPGFAKRYTGVDFKEIEGIENGGKLEIPTNASQLKHEYEKNKKALTMLANKGLKFRMLPVIEDGSKNPDALDLTTNLWSDVKVSETNNFSNIINNSFKKASKQGSTEVIIQLVEMPSSRDAHRILKGALNPDRNKHIERIIFIHRDNFKTYDAVKLRDRFYNKKSDK